MDNDALRRLREPGAWVLLGSVGLQFLTGLISLFSSNVSFTDRAYFFATGDGFSCVLLAGLATLAVLLATRLGGAPTRQARTVALVALILLGGVALFEVIALLAGFGAGGGATGVLLDAPVAGKFAMFLDAVARLAVLGVAGFYILRVHRSLAPATPQYPGVYGQQPQPPYGPAYGQPQQPYQQPYGDQVYGDQRYGGDPAYGERSPYAQPPQTYPPSNPGAPSGPGAPSYYPPAAPPPGQPTGPSTPPRAYPPAAPAQPPSPPPVAGDPGGGEWTIAYGATEPPAPLEQHGDEHRSEPKDPYRPPE